jgi:hypothetical protein
MGLWEHERTWNETRKNIKIASLRWRDFQGAVKSAIMMLQEYQSRFPDQNLFLDVDDGDELIVYREESDKEFNARRSLEKEAEAIAAQVREVENAKQRAKDKAEEYQKYLILKAKFEGDPNAKGS